LYTKETKKASWSLTQSIMVLKMEYF